MKLVTWNVNSLNARLPRVLEFLGMHAPDVVLLQETKTEPDAFPIADLAAAGYGAVHHSAGRWAGVAILAREGLALTDAVHGLPGEHRTEEARWIEATAGGLRVASTYVTNGRAVGTPTFAEKLAFLDAMRGRHGPPATWPGLNVTPAERHVEVAGHDRGGPVAGQPPAHGVEEGELLGEGRCADGAAVGDVGGRDAQAARRGLDPARLLGAVLAGGGRARRR